MSEDKIAWKPAAMSRIEAANESPPGFQSLVFVTTGIEIGSRSRGVRLILFIFRATRWIYVPIVCRCLINAMLRRTAGHRTDSVAGAFVPDSSGSLSDKYTLAVFSTIRRRPQVGPGTGKNGVFSWYSKVNFVHSTHACTFGFAILLGCRKVNPGIIFRVKVLLLVPVMHIFPMITFSKILPLVRRLKTSSRFSCDVSWMIIS